MDTDLYFDRQRTLSVKFTSWVGTFVTLLSIVLVILLSTNITYQFTGIRFKDTLLTFLAGTSLISIINCHLNSYKPVHPDAIQSFLKLHERDASVISYVDTVIESGVILRNIHLKKEKIITEYKKPVKRKDFLSDKVKQQNKEIMDLLNGGIVAKNKHEK